MQSPFSAKRKPRRIGQDVPEESRSASTASGYAGHAPDPTLTVDGPKLPGRSSSSKPKKRSSLRMSFGPGGTSMNDDEGDTSSSAVFTPKKSNLSRKAIENNAIRKSLAPAITIDNIPSRHDEDRPSYNADTLDELKASTPSTPKDLRSQSDVPSEGQELDLAAKFGSDLALQRDLAIPTDAEIKEKKERRARLAKEREYISLDSDGEPQGDDGEASDSDASSNNETSILPYAGPRRLKEPASRLVQDDEEIGEGFDDFVSDGRVALGKKAEREQRRRQKAEMKTMIEEAEGSDDSSEDGSEVERRAAYEAAQTRKGMDGLKKQEEGPRPRRPGTPPRISPLPTLGGVLERLREKKQGRLHERKVQQARLESVRKELKDIDVRKEEVQRLMTEAGERFEKLRAEVLAEKGGGEEQGLMEANRPGVGIGVGMRGLESMGTG